MSASVTGAWEGFFVAEAGASAALAGLIFVALSINLPKILQYPSLPGRAAEGLLSLMQVLFVATLGLAPGQSPRSLGIEILLTGLVVCALVATIQVRAYRGGTQQLWWVLERMILGLGATAPFIVAGSMLAGGAEGGLGWCVVGVLGAFVHAASNAWVLMVEILR